MISIEFHINPLGFHRSSIEPYRILDRFLYKVYIVWYFVFFLYSVRCFLGVCWGILLGSMFWHIFWCIFGYICLVFFGVYVLYVLGVYSWVYDWVYCLYILKCFVYFWYMFGGILFDTCLYIFFWYILWV